MRGRSLSEHSESYEIQLTLTYHRSNSGFRFSPCARATEEEPAATVVFAQWSKYKNAKNPDLDFKSKTFMSFKVQVFEEGHKNLPLDLVKSRLFQIFVAFSECPNFNACL